MTLLIFSSNIVLKIKLAHLSKKKEKEKEEWGEGVGKSNGGVAG